ncbi:hypothetical protein TVAG_336840 [Trichomonas vaginalis G3]|uniref:Uncharacterized protein n=1 Tax=Trichomonas vaginalis (strain ATCC PRA-98 / G3) TaxID=412133 RepID=A2EPV4_TRIV3|nr:leucine-rich repeats (6 copies)-containing protein [Trichomonas vaginalis G3]EAY05292.1 hypothetical protein TVAG_336840 [Trichomonas vaginalis G3]KAI5531875.1 leucine-rich repeats (6 copies)-containing protein [Trichomonas vaginalis G3]|eukprot:XP_001317515.1 hypothetical protein [Trichomonas vaginalis G3]
MLGNVYTVPKSVKYIESDSIRNVYAADLAEINALDDGTTEKKPRDQKGGIAGSAILKIPKGDFIYMSPQAERYFLRFCYDNDKYLRTNDQNVKTYDTSYYATDDYHYEFILQGSKYTIEDCSEKLTDLYKWRHVEGFSKAEIGLIAFIAAAGLIIIILLILYLLPLCKHAA